MKYSPSQKISGLSPKCRASVNETEHGNASVWAVELTGNWVETNEGHEKKWLGAEELPHEIELRENLLSYSDNDGGTMEDGRSEIALERVEIGGNSSSLKREDFVTASSRAVRREPCERTPGTLASQAATLRARREPLFEAESILGVTISPDIGLSDGDGAARIYTVSSVCSGTVKPSDGCESVGLEQQEELKSMET
jgi:hypothetical protein